MATLENPGTTVLNPNTSVPFTIEGREVGFPAHPPGSLNTKVHLACVIKPPIPTYESEWILPNQSVISSSMSRYTVQQSEQKSGVNLLLYISAVSYVDAGVYVCRSRDTNDASPEWISSSIEIHFPGICLYMLFSITDSLACTYMHNLHPQSTWKCIR